MAADDDLVSADPHGPDAFAIGLNAELWHVEFCSGQLTIAASISVWNELVKQLGKVIREQTQIDIPPTKLN